jgi:uncharacterized protein Usg
MLHLSTLYLLMSIIGQMSRLDWLMGLLPVIVHTTTGGQFSVHPSASTYFLNNENDSVLLLLLLLHHKGVAVKFPELFYFIPYLQVNEKAHLHSVSLEQLHTQPTDVATFGNSVGSSFGITLSAAVIFFNSFEDLVNGHRSLGAKSGQQEGVRVKQYRTIFACTVGHRTLSYLRHLLLEVKNSKKTLSRDSPCLGRRCRHITVQ